ncbi:hypothetical protein GKD14_20750 [Paeniclostridium sordellii]|nr:hypothetical protein [Paeniclostridium sordellii]
MAYGWHSCAILMARPCHRCGTAMPPAWHDCANAMERTGTIHRCNTIT